MICIIIKHLIDLVFNTDHFDIFINYVFRALVNFYKAQRSPAVQQVGVSAFYQVVSFVCEDTLRHPPTRQYLSSCVEILGQVHKHLHKHTHASYTEH